MPLLPRTSDHELLAIYLGAVNTGKSNPAAALVGALFFSLKASYEHLHQLGKGQEVRRQSPAHSLYTSLSAPQSPFEADDIMSRNGLKELAEDGWPCAWSHSTLLQMKKPGIAM